MASSSSFSLARQLRAGETVYSGWCGLASPLVAEVIAREGFAAVTIDMQHGLWDTTETVGAIAAIRHGGAAPVVRVPLGDFATASRALWRVQDLPMEPLARPDHAKSRGSA